MKCCVRCGIRPAFGVMVEEFCEYCERDITKHMHITLPQYRDMKQRRMTINHYLADVKAGRIPIAK